MAIVATLDFEDENIRKAIMKKYFTKLEVFGTIEKETLNKQITESPIVREAYLRERFKEIDFDDMMRDLENIRTSQNKEKQEAPSEETLFTEQEIGKATINVPTQKKEEAQQSLQKEATRKNVNMEQTQ